MLKIILLAVLVFSLPIYAYETTMNFAYKIGSDKNEIIHVNNVDYSAASDNNQIFTSMAKKYISSRRGSSVFGVFFSGDEFVSAGFDSSYSGTEYLVHLTQGSRSNRFLIGFANTTQGSYDSAYDVVDIHKIILTTISSASYGFVPNNFYMIIEIDALLASYIKWSGAVNLIIKNNGLKDGLYNISLEV